MGLKLVGSLVKVVLTTVFTVLTQNFQKIILFCSVLFFKNHENLVFGTQLVPIFSNFSISKNIDILKNAFCGGIKISLF